MGQLQGFQALLDQFGHEVEVFSTIPVSLPLPQSATETGAGRLHEGSHGLPQPMASLCRSVAEKKETEDRPPGVAAGGFQGASELLLHSGTKRRSEGLTVAGNTLLTTSAVRAAMSQA